MRLALIPLCIFSLSGCMTAGDPHTGFTPLLDGIEQRLDLAEAVALHKWDNRQPVQDTPREQQVLANVRLAAADHEMKQERAASFFGDQIEANKLMQYHLLTQWHLLGSAPDSPRRDLATEIRPQLDHLQERLLRNLASFDQHPAQECSKRLAETIAYRSTSASRRLLLIRATANLCPLADH